MSERLHADGVVVRVEHPELLERALTTFKKRTAALKAELVRRSYYTPPSARRRAKSARARARDRKNLRRRLAAAAKWIE